MGYFGVSDIACPPPPNQASYMYICINPFLRVLRVVELGCLLQLLCFKVLHLDEMFEENMHLFTHFYVGKLGFARGLTIYFFFIFALKLRLWVLVRTTPARRF